MLLVKLMNLVLQAHGYKALVMIGDGATDLEVSKFIQTSIVYFWQISIRKLLKQLMFMFHKLSHFNIHILNEMFFILNLPLTIRF